MNNLLTVSPSPHIRAFRSTTTIMATVLLALLPAMIASIFLYGLRAALILAISNIACGLFEYIWCKLRKLENTVWDLSTFVTGTLLALSLPANFGEVEHLWKVVFGAAIAIIVTKAFFGGIGYNFANPAITARIAMFICFPDIIGESIPTNLQNSAELVSGATPLGDMQKGNFNLLPSYKDMFLGNHPGAIGETCAVALLIGGLLLIATKVISWHIPVSFIGTVAIFTWITGGSFGYALYHVLAGGLFIGAFFMATDYVTSPDTPKGKIIFGIGCGLITAVIRVYGAYPEGVSFAILLMNILNPYIIKLTRRKPFGGIKQ